MPKELITKMSRQQYEELLAGHIFHLTGLPYRPHPRTQGVITVPENKYFAEKKIAPLQLETCLGSGHWNVTKEDIDAYYYIRTNPLEAAKKIIEVGV